MFPLKLPDTESQLSCISMPAIFWPAGLTQTLSLIHISMGRMHSDAQFAGSSSVPAHVEMMGLIGMGNNPMVGATVAVAVSVQQAADEGKF